ncbi:MAG TPA: DegT/DnrJ/EryC1/StrS family aminotransferase [Longimicrobiales bacterium]|nr:DegT/DnrJ/EryC1/StrS family aminotransferase [Longimicrobiales bacterium]
MAVPFLDLRAQYAGLRDEVETAMAAVIEDQKFILGPAVEAFESDFAAVLGARHAVGCASGTDALFLALRALELTPGDEVVVPAFTFFATAGAVWNAGLRPRFADVDNETFNLTVETLEAAVTSRTRAVIVVHLFGQMAPMEPILAYCQAHDLAVIEDVAQAFGARQEIGGVWRNAGTVGAAGCFSFFPTKVLGGFGDGGLVATDDERIARRVRSLRVHGSEEIYRHDLVGVNSRLDALQAAVLRVKLPHAREWVRSRRAVARAYDSLLARLSPAVRTPPVARYNESAHNVYTIRVERRDELRRWLGDAGIATSVYYPIPLHLQPCFAELGHRPGDLPVSEQLATEVVSLPIYPEMSEAQIDEVVSRIASFYEGPARSGSDAR